MVADLSASSVDLRTSTASGALRALSRRDVSSVELLDAVLARVERVNGDINAVVALDVDRARAQAMRADVARFRGEPVGLLHGLPITVKDSFATRGLVTTSGHPRFAGVVPEADAAPVAALRRAGAVIYGKTNVPDLCRDFQTSNEIYGLTRNPWATDRTVGGSSGGAAAAVAAGLSLLEVGSDIGGSIRNPAHYTGVFGHKPTWNAVDRFGEIPGTKNWQHRPVDMGVTGPLGRSTADLMLGLKVLTAGSVGGVPGASLPEASPRARAVRSLRLGFIAADPEVATSADCMQAVLDVATAFEQAGASVRPVTLPQLTLAEQFALFLVLLSGAEELDRNLTYGAWAKADERRHRLAAAYDRLLHDEIDVLVTPIAPTPAFPHSVDVPWRKRSLSVDGVDTAYLAAMAWAAPASMCWLPATAVPVRQSDDGLPIGVQIIGPRLGDLSTLAVSFFVEGLLGGFTPPPGSRE